MIMPSSAENDGLHYGWVALVASFFLNFLVDGYNLVFGYIRLFIEEDYPTYPPWMIASICGVSISICLTLAPICIATLEIFGSTCIVIFAALTLTTTFFLTWVNTFLNFGFLFDFLMLAVLQGVSSALLYGPSIALISQYFPPHQRSIAAGIATLGSSVGAIFYSIITPTLFAKFGWRGSMLIYGGISLNAVIAAFAFLDRLNPSKKERIRRASNNINNNNNGSSTLTPSVVNNADLPLSLLLPSNSAERPPDDSESVPIPPCYILKKISEDKRRNRLDTNHSLDKMIITFENDLVRMSSDESESNSEENDTTITPSKDVVTIDHQKQNDEPTSKPPYFVKILKRFFNPKLVYQPYFLCLLGAAVFSSQPYYIPTLLIPGHAKQNVKWHLSTFVQTNLLLFWAVANTIGRLVSARLSDVAAKNDAFSNYSIFIVGHTVSSFALLIFPNYMYMGDNAFFLFIVVYGFFSGLFITTRSVIIADIYGQEKANSGSGWFLCIQGIFQTAGFALPTWLDEFSTTYAYGYGAACFLVAPFFVAITSRPYFKVRRKINGCRSDEK